MATYTLRTEITRPYEAAVTATRAALAEQGFGIISEIDLAATLKAKLDVDLPPEVILGACRPPLAYESIQTDPRSPPSCRATSSCDRQPAAPPRSSRPWTPPR